MESNFPVLPRKDPQMIQEFLLNSAMPPGARNVRAAQGEVFSAKREASKTAAGNLS